MNTNALLEKLQKEGLRVSVIAQYVLSNRNIHWEPNKSILFAIDKAKEGWQTGPIFEEIAYELLINLNQRRGVTLSQEQEILNLQQVYKCLKNRHYSDLLNMPYTLVLRNFVLEALNMFKREIITQDYSMPQRNNYEEIEQSNPELAKDMNEEEILQQASVKNAEDLLIEWSQEGKKFWPLFENSNRRNS